MDLWSGKLGKKFSKRFYMQLKFYQKNILIFSPQFFGYGMEVAKKLQKLGAKVDYYDERPGNDFITKALIRLKKSLLSQKIDAYYSTIIAKQATNIYDYVLFLNPEAISTNKIQQLRKSQSKATFIMYMWDSLLNKKYTLDLLPYFDHKYTFDREDSLNRDHDLNFRPLFFLDAYRNDGSVSNQITTDLLFVGTLHSDRYKLLMEIEQVCRKMGKSHDFYMFFQSEKLYYAQKATNKFFRSAKKDDFAFDSLSKEQIIEKIRNSRVVLDIQHPDQKGLTMRTIEMIGARKKIITTNMHIKNYDFYDPRNIYYIDRKNIELNSSFFETEYKMLHPAIYHKYSIDGWLEDVFSI